MTCIIHRWKAFEMHFQNNIGFTMVICTHHSDFWLQVPKKHPFLTIRICKMKNLLGQNNPKCPDFTFIYRNFVMNQEYLSELIKY